MERETEMKLSNHFTPRFAKAMLISVAAVAVAVPAGQAKYLTPSSDTLSSTGQLDPIIANAIRNYRSEVRGGGQLDPIIANAIRNYRSEARGGGQLDPIIANAIRNSEQGQSVQKNTSPPRVVPSADRGFAWEDFGIGIATALAVLFLFAVMLRTKHLREARQKAKVTRPVAA
jgi:hypothetical protein